MNKNHDKNHQTKLQGLLSKQTKPFFVWLVASLSGVTLEYSTHISDWFLKLFEGNTPPLYSVIIAWPALLGLWLLIAHWIDYTSRSSEKTGILIRSLYGLVLLGYAFLAGVTVKITHLWIAVDRVLSWQAGFMGIAALATMYAVGRAAEPILNYFRQLREEEVVTADGETGSGTYTIENPLPLELAPDYIIMAMSDSKDHAAKQHILAGVKSFQPNGSELPPIEEMLGSLTTQQQESGGLQLNEEANIRRIKQNPLYHMVYEAGVLFKAPKPPKIHVLVSEQTVDEWGELELFLEKLLRISYGEIDVPVPTRADVDIFSYQSIFDAVVQAADDATGRGAQRICVELTRATKMYSIAAAIAASGKDLPTAYLTTDSPNNDDLYELIYRYLKPEA